MADAQEQTERLSVQLQYSEGGSSPLRQAPTPLLPLQHRVLRARGMAADTVCSEQVNSAVQGRRALPTTLFCNRPQLSPLLSALCLGHGSKQALQKHCTRLQALQLAHGRRACNVALPRLPASSHISAPSSTWLPCQEQTCRGKPAALVFAVRWACVQASALLLTRCLPLLPTAQNIYHPHFALW